MALIDAAIKRAKAELLSPEVRRWLDGQKRKNECDIVLAEDRRAQTSHLAGQAAELAQDEYRHRMDYLRQLTKFFKTHLTIS